MKCLFCGSENLKVLDSRELENGRKTRRRKQCNNCGKRFSTIELPMELNIIVKKNSGQEEQFSREKLIRGIEKASEKRPISFAQIEEFIDHIEKFAREKYDNLIPSRAIGEEVMKWLKEIDHVAYIRYASVYKDFQDIDSIINVVSGLKGESSNNV